MDDGLVPMLVDVSCLGKGSSLIFPELSIDHSMNMYELTILVIEWMEYFLGSFVVEVFVIQKKSTKTSPHKMQYKEWC